MADLEIKAVDKDAMIKVDSRWAQHPLLIHHPGRATDTHDETVVHLTDGHPLLLMIGFLSAHSPFAFTRLPALPTINPPQYEAPKVVITIHSSPHHTML